MSLLGRGLFFAARYAFWGGLKGQSEGTSLSFPTQGVRAPHFPCPSGGPFAIFIYDSSQEHVAILNLMLLLFFTYRVTKGGATAMREPSSRQPRNGSCAFWGHLWTCVFHELQPEKWLLDMNFCTTAPRHLRQLGANPGGGGGRHHQADRGGVECVGKLAYSPNWLQELVEEIGWTKLGLVLRHQELVAPDISAT